MTEQMSRHDIVNIQIDLLANLSDPHQCLYHLEYIYIIYVYNGKWFVTTSRQII